MRKPMKIQRRHFLTGLGGAVVGLPALDIFTPRVRAQNTPKKVYAAFMLQQNGCIQGRGGDPDMFWPRSEGQISASDMAGIDADRATSELKDYADKVNFVRGLDFHYSSNHDGGPVAALTGAPVRGSGTSQLPVSESADYFIASRMTPGVEPLTLYAGRKNTFRDDALSFSSGGNLRIGDNNPWNVYQRLMELSGVDPMMVDQIAKRRLSVNDLVRKDLQSLLSRSDLSKADRERLDLHFSSIRDIEMGITRPVEPALDQNELQNVDGEHTENSNMEKVVRMQLDLIAFAFASDRVRTATLQVGGCNDHTRYVIHGVEQPPYHYISHRVMSDGGDGEGIDNAVELHHQIDRIHARYFKHLLDRLAAYTLPDGGTLLDSSVNLWVNSVSDGPPHSGGDVPHVLAGGAGGFLKTGLHIKTGGFTSRILNTSISATGVRTDDGNVVEEFGDSDDEGRGLVNDIVR
jgi:hypothetical protein